MPHLQAIEWPPAGCLWRKISNFASRLQDDHSIASRFLVIFPATKCPYREQLSCRLISMTSWLQESLLTSDGGVHNMYFLSLGHSKRYQSSCDPRLRQTIKLNCGDCKASNMYCCFKRPICCNQPLAQTKYQGNMSMYEQQFFCSSCQSFFI